MTAATLPTAAIKPSPPTVRVRALLAAILIAGVGLRLYGVTFGLPALLDADEMIFIGGAHQLLASGNLNPGWFGHPATTTIYVVALVGASVLALGLATGRFASPDDFILAMFLDPGIVVLPGRIIMIAFAVASIWLTWRLAHRLAGPVAGLVAAAMIAFNPVHISWSQVIRSDIMALTFLLLTALYSHKYLEHGQRRHAALACLFTGLAITSKWPFALAFIALVGAIILRHWRQAPAGASMAAPLKAIAVAGALTILATILICPHLVLDYPTLLSNLQGEAMIAPLGGMAAGGATGGILDNFAFYLGGPLWLGLGPLGAVLAVAGLVAVRRNAAFWVIAGLPAAAMLGLIVPQTVVWDRWALPLFPALAIAAGCAAARMWEVAPALNGRVRAGLAAVFAAALLLPTLQATLGNTRERLNDNRRLATDWVRNNLPPGARLMVEHFAFDLFDSPFSIIFPIGLAGCLDARDVLTGRITYKQVDALRGGRSNLDYSSVPESRLSTCNADFAILTEHSRYAADREAFPDGNLRYQDLIGRSRVLARFPFVEGASGGRPEVLVLDLRRHVSNGARSADGEPER